jgi:multiple sugar transport system substrate-binding protein
MDTKRLSRAVVSVLLGMAALVASSCARGGGAVATPTTAPVGGMEPITVVIWTAYGKQLAPAVQAYNQKMKDAGKQIQVSMVELGLEEIPDKFAVGLTAGDVPDILDLDLVLAPKFTSMGAFVDITSLVEEAGLRDDFNPKFLDLGVWDGRIYMIPFSADVSALLYNKDLFRAAGLDPEARIETWDDFRKAAVAIKNANLKTKDGLPVYSFVACAGPGSKMFCDMPFIWTNGGDWLGSDGQVILDAPQTLEAFKWYTDLLYYVDKVHPPNPGAITWDDKMNMFANGQAAMICTGSYSIEEFKQRAPNLDYGVFLFPHPAGKGGPSSFIGGDLIGIPKASKHPSEAWDFILYCLSEDVQVEIWARNGMPPVRLSMAKNKYFEAEPRYYVFADGVRYGQVPKTVHYNEFYDPWNVAWEEIYAGSKPLDQILREAADRMREIAGR